MPRPTKAGREADSHFARRYVDEIELPGHAALHAGGSANLRRLAGDLPRLDRSGKERRWYLGHQRTRDKAARRLSPDERPRATRSEYRLGWEPVQHRADLRQLVANEKRAKKV